MKDYLRHRFNPLHMYCRLREAGVAGYKARRICTLYERIYSFFL
ncbi:MAG: hypothetical protein ACOZEN_04085 [Thermodesulfobacteriota bacterium]